VVHQMRFTGYDVIALAFPTEAAAQACLAGL
jgi:hypothetical protein